VGHNLVAGDTMAIGNGEFCTKHTALAAYLYAEGFNLLDVIIENHPYRSNQTIATFVFEDGKQLEECVKLFQVSKAIGNLVLFWEAYRKMIRMTKVGKL